MKTLVGTGEGPEKYNGYKPTDKNPYVPSRGEEQKKAKRGYDNVGPNTYPDGYQPAPKNPDEKKYIERKTQPGPKDYKPETKKPKSGYGQGGPNVYPDGSYPTPNEMYPPKEKGYQESQKPRIKSKLRGGMGAGRGDNPNYYPDGNYYHG